MADKPQKIDISFGDKSAKKDKKPAAKPVQKTSSHSKSRIEPLPSSKPEETDEPAHSDAEQMPESTPVESPLDQDIKNTAQPRSQSDGVDGGFAAAMAPDKTSTEEAPVQPTANSGLTSDQQEAEEPNNEQPESDSAEESKEQPKQPEEDDKQEAQAEPYEVDDQDMLYTDDQDFYSSKLDPNDPKKKSSRGARDTSSTHPPRMSAQYLLVLTTFVLTTIVGLIILYQLEQAEEGAGLIFDWINLSI